MKHLAITRGALAVLYVFPLLAVAGPDTPDAPDAPASLVVVTASRNERPSLDVAASIDVVDRGAINAVQPRVNVSEALAAVPGLVVLDRQNYAQDLQISSRGFGARAAFGVRGVKLVADGIPATMPDGQGQAATFNLDMAERMEVLRGPLSVLYGNHAGGVVQMFTRDPQGDPYIEMSVSGGSDGLRKTDLNAGGREGSFGWLLDGSRFETDGYRDHSAATRDQGYAKLVFDTSPNARLTLVASGLRQDDTQDPLGLTWDSYQRDPRAGEIDASDMRRPRRTLAERYDTRKSIDHQQLGLAWTQRFGAERLQVSLYGGNRRVVQYQSFSKGFQAPASHSGGVVDFDRDFYGLDASYLITRPLLDGTLHTTLGLEAGKSSDARTGYENFIGDQFGVQGRLRRDERDDVRNVDPYLLAEWENARWVLSAGVRYSRVDVDVDDHFLANGDDGGSADYHHTSPLLGVLYKVTPALNVYASAARGFETPTLNEVFYSATGSGVNFGLGAATNTQFELGAKAALGHGVRINGALFQVRTRDELVVDTSSGGRTSYRNASATLRQGLELALDAELRAGFSARLAATWMRAIYDGGFTGVADGSNLPGVPKSTLFAELAWNAADGRLGAGLETIASARIHPDNANLAPPAPGYAILNARVQASQVLGGWRLREYARINNLLEREYVGSVIVGDSNGRYYEPAAGRNWLLGVSARYQF